VPVQKPKEAIMKGILRFSDDRFPRQGFPGRQVMDQKRGSNTFSDRLQRSSVLQQRLEEALVFIIHKDG
jgi:hypothetical protein